MMRRRPGERLRALASRFCSDAAIERLVDPALADLQCEHADAVRRGQPWRRRLVRVAGTLAFWKVIGLHAAARAVPTAREWAAADEHAVGRTMAFALGFIAVVTLTFDYVPLSFLLKHGHRGYYANATLTGRDLVMLALYLVPQALVVSIPVGFACGVLFGLRGRTPAPHVRRAILWMAMLCSVLVFIAVAWVLPESNQAYRELSFGGRLVRGTRELSLRELWAAGHWLDLHLRLALACGPVVLGLFAWSVSAPPRNRTRWFVLGLAGVVAYAAQFVIQPAQLSALAQSVPAVLAAWTPTLIVAAATATILRFSDPQILKSSDS